MEPDLTVFLEFYGLPGSGKSTISHTVVEELRKRGKNVKEPTYDMDHQNSRSLRKLKKIVKLIVFAFVYPKKFLSLLKLVKQNGYSGITVIIQCVNIAYKLIIYNGIKADYVVLDEGLTQSAIALNQNINKTINNELSLYGLIGRRKVIKIYIKTKPEIALNRLEGRNEHDSRVEKIADKVEQTESLKELEMECDVIFPNLIVYNDSISDSVKYTIRNLLSEDIGVETIYY